MIEQIAQLDGETGARARSAWSVYTLYFADIPGISFINQILATLPSDRMKHAG
jgi:hypothetical protein